MPLRDGSFQTVLANSALEHIPAVEEALAECFRVLRKGGMLLVTAPSHKFAGMLWGSGYSAVWTGAAVTLLWGLVQSPRTARPYR
jgi:ubiquinone/menaquinone biosynthesis C-methylase UbiE